MSNKNVLLYSDVDKHNIDKHNSIHHEICLVHIPDIQTITGLNAIVSVSLILMVLGAFQMMSFQTDQKHSQKSYIKVTSFPALL